MKKALLIVWIILLISITSGYAKDKEFTGAFGYKLGDTFCINEYKSRPIIFDLDYLQKINPEGWIVTNKTGFRYFSNCKIWLTPLTENIYRIYSRKTNSVNEEKKWGDQPCKNELLVLQEFFKRKYGFKDRFPRPKEVPHSISDTKIYLKKNDIHITMECYLDNEYNKQKYSLTIQIMSTKLRELFEEESKRIVEEFIQMELNKIDPNSL